ncbi:MAG: chromosome segregation protein SMC [Gemmataceae bacterium]|nr:chromosome segregation protein SMC [Gemmataceae bacterium]
MLKRLELIGFKSFADRTWFSFAPGMTAVVGPNGSGKSNVVDAVKWILGEQSAKSLRGGEMADVIFNGSASRKALGIAEVTLTLENSNKSLNTDAAEIAVTRRVHRDGTGEYLINGQPSRLKDIREIFLGSGAGSTSYCIIEQGRVDAVLQASPQDRRAILEEAAGISRFKAKKLEALRKLEHTNENLVRLRDIHGEVEARLRRVRLDAEKARKFQEHSGRLKELRVGIAIREYHQLTETLSTEEQRLLALRHEMSASQVQLVVWESEAKALEVAISKSDEELSRNNESLAIVRRQIALFHERRQNEDAKSSEVEGELSTARQRSIELAFLVNELEAASLHGRGELAQAEGEAEVRRSRVTELDAAATDLETELKALRNLVRDGRDRQFHLVGRSAALNSDATASRTQIDKLLRERDRKRRETENKSAELDAVGRVLDTLGHKGTGLQKRLALARRALADRNGERESLRSQADRLVELLENLRVRRSGLTGRIEVLENLERTQEGLGTGVREVLADLRESTSRLSQVVLGLVADSLRVPREVAPLVDIALGDVASHFVVADMGLLNEALAERSNSLAGRASFLPLASVEPASAGDERRTLDRWVSSERDELKSLPRQLLGRTLVVENLQEARALRTDLDGYRFVSRAGEMLAADGTLTVGRYHAEGGIVSRKSELRELHVQAAALDVEVGSTEQKLSAIRDQAESLAGPILGLEEEILALTSNAADLQAEVLKQTQRRERLTDDIAMIRQEWEMIEEELQRLEELWRETRGKAEEAERQAEELKTQIETADHAIRGYEHERATRQQEQTAARVALAETIQRLTGLRDAQQRLEADLARGRSEVERVEHHEGVLIARRDESDLASLRATAGMAEAFHSLETLESGVLFSISQRDSDRARRAELLTALESSRSESQCLGEQLHARELASHDFGASRDRVADRLREDYQFDLSAEYSKSPFAKGESPSGDWDATAAAKEVEELRKKIRHLGNVSLESLVELSEVEKRANDLQSQLNDLTEAENSLRAVINKINEDSKILFVQTYDLVRTHFQELFRKLFGGGMADVVLDNPDDVLESGLDIVARPPGKELRGLSLMSGGEKTLTAVALLLAIFRSKPSPFCLLDEVDAALDEANTERLARTIRDFSGESQFIVITHKKRTMAYADVLYGITMQESGISKQIAVRFEDWPEEQTTSRAA